MSSHKEYLYKDKRVLTKGKETGIGNGKIISKSRLKASLKKR